MRGACLTENILYYAGISCDDKTYKPKLYNGICKTTLRKLQKIFQCEKEQQRY